MRASAADGAFCAHERTPEVLAGAPSGPLAGLRVAVKDVFDVAGYACCCGNPDWLATHGPAEATASAVGRLMGAGATLVGKTITDELAYSIDGRNHWYGAPANPAAPDRLSGGSSSGSASAVAGGGADLALGTDTGGSTRVPASWTGIFGIRPTHGAIARTACSRSPRRSTRAAGSRATRRPCEGSGASSCPTRPRTRPRA